MSRIPRRFTGHLGIHPEDTKFHLVLIYEVKNEIWEPVPRTKTLIVPTGDLEIIAEVDFKNIVRAYHKGQDAPLPDQAKPFLFQNMGNHRTSQGTYTNYRFFGQRPATTAKVPLVEYHIFETTPRKDRWTGRCAYLRQDGTVNPVVFKHIRYTKERKKPAQLRE